MTDTVAVARSRPALIAIVVYALRTCVAGRRSLGLVAAVLAAVLFGFLSAGLSGDPTRDFAEVAGLALFGLVLPVACLVIGDAVLGAELRSGAFAFTWLAPVPTWKIAVGRWLAGSLVAATSMAVAFAAAAFVAGAPDSAAPVALGGAMGAVAYVAVFIAIGCIARRAAAWSLGFVFLIERLLGEALSGIAQLSPTWEARAVFLGVSGAPADLVKEGIPQGWGAVVRLLIIAAVSLAIASRRLSSLKLSGSSD